MADRTLQAAAKAFIQDDQGRLLLLQRSKPYIGENSLKWDLPGGRADIGEKLEDALRRELLEETGLTLQSLEAIFDVQDLLAHPELHVVRVTYLAKATGEIALSHEHNDFGWFQKDELPVEAITSYLLDTLRTNGWIAQAEKAKAK